MTGDRLAAGGVVGPAGRYLLAADTPCFPMTRQSGAGVFDALGIVVEPWQERYVLAVMQFEDWHARHVAARELVERRWHEVAWNIDDYPNALGVPDLTRGLDAWPVQCEARWVIQAKNPAYLYPRVFVCTRIADHTGRHAAGGLGRITAVWGDRR